MLFETGRVCLKTAGREAGKICVVLDKVDKDFVLVTGPKALSGVKKRKCNMAHLEPLDAKLKLKADSSDEDILELIKKEEGLLKKWNLSVPSTADIKKWEAQRSEKENKKEAVESQQAAEKPKEQPKKEEKKTVSLSDLAAEQRNLGKDKKPTSLSDLASETKKLESQKVKKDGKKK